MAALSLLVVWCAALMAMRPRHSLVFLVLSAVVVLPIASFFGQRRRMTLVCFCVAPLLALSPIDYTVQRSGSWSVRLLPVSHGIFCKPDTACYGCVVFGDDPKYALVLGY